MTVSRILLSAVAGLGLLAAALAAADTHYVAQAGQTPAPGYTNGWPSAASNIQDAVNAASEGDTVLVSNGVYQTGGVTAGTILTNRVYISKAITVRSANNDPENTIIKGAWDPATINGPAAIRCVSMVSGSSLIGFTLTNGATYTGGDATRLGGGVCSYNTTNTTISNCVIVYNCASFYGGGAAGGTFYNCKFIGNRSQGNDVGYGGGAYQANLFNCTISNNTAFHYGGGAYGCSLYNCMIANNLAGRNGAVYNSISYNCTIVSNVSNVGGGALGGSLYNCLLVGNQASQGGGARDSILYNCTVVGNKATTGGGVRGGTVYNCVVYSNSVDNWYDTNSLFNYSCTFPTQKTWVAGSDNITNDPMFTAWGSGYGADHVPGNYRLIKGSPCINAGSYQSWMTNALDLDGRLRVRDRAVDMGCYEFISKGAVLMFR